MSTRSWMKAHWGFCLFSFSLVVTYLWRLQFDPVGHYSVFSGAASLIWDHQNPYWRDIPGGTGWFLYSPACAMFFFGPFAMLPAKWGEALYMLVSFIVLGFGLRFAISSLKDNLNFDLWGFRYRNWFWLMISSELTGAILAVKVEIVMLGLLFFAFGYAIQGTQGRWKAALLLGMLVNWKLQPLPIAGLLCALAVVFDRDWKTPVAFFGALAFSFLVPFAFLPNEFVVAMYKAQSGSLQEFVARDWYAHIFHHLYSFWYELTGVRTDLATANQISVAFGAGLAVILLAYVKKIEDSRVGALLAFGLGSAYTVLCSPLSQSTAYLLYTPMVLGLFYFAKVLGREDKSFFWTLFAGYYFISLSVSDFTPQPLRGWLYDNHYKVLGIVILLSLLMKFMLNSLGEKRTTLQGAPA